MQPALVTLAVLLVGLGLPSAAQAQAVSLTGETLTSLPPASAEGTCARSATDTGPSTGTSTYTYEISGVAAGPYPGTFTETGSFTIGPIDEEFLPGQFRGDLLSFEAEFTITGANGTVEGTKTLATGFNVGVCQHFGFIGQPDQSAGQTAAHALTYTATITLPDGSQYTDTGTSRATFNYCTSSGLGCGTSSSNQFTESFVSEELVPVDQDAAVVVLTPPADVNPVGSQHAVTAIATTATSGPAEGVKIRFSVLGASDAQGSCTTDAQGQCTFTYTGPELPGADLITGCADNDDSGTIDPGEPCGEATKIWMMPATTPGQVTGGGWITVDGNRVSFGFNAQSDAAAGTAKGNCNVIDHATRTQIKCKTVDSLVVTPTHATFFGQATVDGTTTNYRIDVDDLGEPGTADTFKIQTDGGYTAAGTLRGGNIQIHPR
jgi:hypothetical protein